MSIRTAAIRSTGEGSGGSVSVTVATWPKPQGRFGGREEPMRKTLQKITPFLWFENEAEEAANFYVPVFGNSRIRGITRYEAEAARASGRPEGSVMTVAFELEGQEFTALNGGPHFKFTEAISFVVHCDDSGRGRPLLGEAVRRWSRSRGVAGSRTGSVCRGRSFPALLVEMLQDKEPQRAKRVDGGTAEDEEDRRRSIEAGIRGASVRRENSDEPS